MPESGQTEVVRALQDAMATVGLRKAVGGIYHDIEEQLQRIRPACAMSGQCCKFEQYGHRLFVTTAELAVFVLEVRECKEAGLLASGADGGGCRFQQGKWCAVHANRPMGCRLFFCDASHEQELRDLYETMHGRIKALHDRLGIAYFYMEWRGALSSAMAML